MNPAKLTAVLLFFTAVTLTPLPVWAQEGSTHTMEEEENLSNREAGEYERKSVSFIDAVWLMDPSVRNMPDKYVRTILDRFKEKIMMKRFDFNPLPESLISDFVNQANALDFPAASGSGESYGAALSGFKPQRGDDPMLDSITAIMERTLVPKIVDIVNTQKEMRARGLLTEQQQNSFITDKAKETGITASELKRIMNSAFIFIPLARAYGAGMKDKTYRAKMDVGIIWWRITTTGDRPRAEPVVKKFSLSIGQGVSGKNYITRDGTVGYREFAFRSLVKNGVRNLVVATQELPEFRLSTQVLEKNFGSVTFEMGEKEGVRVDQKFRIIHKMDNGDGTVTTKKRGWVMVNRIGKGDGVHRTKARIIAGSPRIGSELSEYPRLGLDISLSGRNFPFSAEERTGITHTIDSLDMRDAYGFGAHASYNFGQFIRIPQLWFDFGFGLGFGSAEGSITLLEGFSTISYPFKSTTAMTFEFSLIKKFYLRRLAVSLQPIFGLQSVSVTTDKMTSGIVERSYRLENGAMGFAVHGGIDFAITPAINLAVGGGYQLYGEFTEWTAQRREGSGKREDVSITGLDEDTPVNHSGIRLQGKITFSPPALPFDPLDFLRSRIGI